jgi:hypothetical protein
MNISATSWAKMFRAYLKALLSIGLLCLILPVAGATNYYVAANGSDTSAGTSPSTAWKTISRVNSRMNSYAAGDSILFQRGDVWRDTTLFITTTAATPAAKIVFGAYGTGAEPAFMGSAVVTGWTQINGQPIWWAPYDKWAMNLYRNNKLLTVARYPNSGWLTATADGTKTTFTDTALGKPANYFKDARVHMHTVNFKWEYATVTAQTSGGNFTYSPATEYSHQKGFGYYLDGKYSLLDTTNEWFCDTIADRIYVYSDTDPSAALYEAPSTLLGIVFDYNRNNVVVQDLDLRQHADACIYMNYSTNCVVRNTAMRQANNYGLINQTGSHDTLIGCTVEDINGNGIEIGARNSAILHNTVRRIALVPGYGKNAYADHGIITGPASYTAYNKIDSIANLGLGIDSGSIGEKNIINCACIVMNDCGGLTVPFGTAVYNNNQDTVRKGYNIILRNNFVSNSVGGTFGTPPGNMRIANGIYYGGGDDTNVNSINNTVINCSLGISMLDTWHSSAIGNTVYNCETGINNIVLSNPHPQNNNIIKQNVIYGIEQAQIPLSFSNNYNTIMPNNFNISDSNWLINPYSDIVFRTNIKTPSGGFPSIKYTISRLWAERGHDLNSKGNFKLLTPFKSYTVASPNYVTNSTFNTNINGWGSNQNFAVPFVWDAARAGMTGGSLKFGNQANTYAQPLVPFNGLTTNSAASNWYRLKWKAIGDNPNYLQTEVQALSPSGNSWSVVATSKSFAIDTTANTREYFFQLPAGTGSYRAGFYIGPETPNIYLNWLDNVEANQITVVPDIAPELRSPLFTNMTDNVVNIPLNGLTYLDVNGKYVCGDQLTLQPWSSQVLMLVDEDMAKPVLTSASQPNLVLPNVNECRWYHFDAGSNERAVSVHPQGNNLDSVTTQTYIASGAVRSIGSRKVLGRNWVVTPSGTPGTPVKVRLYFSQAELDTLMAAAPSVTGVDSLMLTEYSGPNQDSSWANNTPSAANNVTVPVNFTAYQNGYYVEFSTNSFSEFWLSEEPNTPLPVELIAFSGTCQGNSAVVSWQTEQASGLSRFVIEKSSDAAKYVTIGEVAARNTSNPEFYSFSDPSALCQPAYYRLRIVSVNGDSSFSQTVRVDARGQDCTTDLHATRTGDNRLGFSWSRKKAIADLDVRVFNSIGQTVFREVRSVTAGNDVVRVNLPELPQGTYILTLTGGGLQLSTKFYW